MAAHWIITTLEESGKHANYITSSKWVHGATPAAEGLGAYNLVMDIKDKTKHASSGEIIAHTDNKKIVNGVHRDVYRKVCAHKRQVLLSWQ